MIGNVHHFGYLVRSIEKSTKPFISLGYHVESEKYYDFERKTYFSFLRKDNNRVELVEPTVESEIYPLLRQYKNQIYHVCYKVDNIDDVVKNLGGGGYLLFKNKQKAPAISDNAIVVFLMHTNMGIIELLQEVNT